MNKRISVVSILIVTCIALVVAFGAVMVSQNMKSTTTAPAPAATPAAAASVTVDPTVATMVADLDNAQAAIDAATSDATGGDVNGCTSEAAVANTCLSQASGVGQTAQPSEQLRLAAAYGVDVSKEVVALDKGCAAVLSGDGQAASDDGATVGANGAAAQAERATYEACVGQ